MYAALVLLAITLVVNIIGAVIIQRAPRRTRTKDSDMADLTDRHLRPIDDATDPFAGVDFSQLERLAAPAAHACSTSC